MLTAYACPMASKTFGEIMKSVAQRMRADFAQTATVNHRGGKGASREEIVREFMVKYLPRRVEATGRGEIITADERVSPECDILIVDSSTPPFMDRQDYRIVPVECVHGIVEVKSHLDGRELRDACEKIKAVKSLPKTAYGPPATIRNHAQMYGRLYDYLPTAGLIFAFESIDLQELARQCSNWSTDEDLSLVPDGIWVLGKGHLLWSKSKGDLQPRPDPESELAVMQADPDQGNLLQLAVHLNVLFSYAWMRPLALQEYAGLVSEGIEMARFGSATRGN